MRHADSFSHSHSFANSPWLSVPIASVLVGAALLLAGRRLFWLFVAAVGFVTGENLAAQWLPTQDQSVALMAGAIIGVAGALLALFVQKVAVGIAGAVAGAYFTQLFIEASALGGTPAAWIALVVGAIVGALLMVYLFKWALIVFSSIAGAHLITQTTPLTPQLSGAAFIVLVIVGIITQARQLHPAA